MANDESRREKERRRLLQLANRRPQTDDFVGTGVVLSDGIKFYCRQFDLISPFDEAKLKPANYKLSVGDEYAIGGKVGTLSDEPGRDSFIISPFEVAIIWTLETINMPRFLIGRWNIQVKKAYEGLLWVGGPQVDAGYVGHLCCPIYNLSARPVTLRYRESFAVIDFVKTTIFTAGLSKPYGEGENILPDRILFDDYKPHTLESALVTLVTEKLTRFENRLGSLENRTDQHLDRLENRTSQFVGTTINVFGVLFAALGILLAMVAVFVSRDAEWSMPVWTFVSLALSVLALLIALGANDRILK